MASEQDADPVVSGTSEVGFPVSNASTAAPGCQAGYSGGFTIILGSLV